MTPSKKLLELFNQNPNLTVDVVTTSIVKPLIHGLSREDFTFTLSKSGVVNAYIDEYAIVTSFSISKEK